eukprot:jgi/Tetstr1/428837/TSEL_018824.t1
MAPLLPSLYMRVGGLVGAPPAHSRDRTPVAMAWKDETACTKRLVVLLDDLATVEWDVSNVASGHQPEAPLEYCPGPADVPYVAVTGCVDLVLGLVVVLLTPAPNLNSPSGKRPPNTSGAQVLMYDVLAKKRHTRGLSLRDCPHSVAPLESVPQDISINCSGDILLTCLEDEIRLFSISAKPSAGHSQGGWFASAAKPHRQLWPMQSFSSAFIGARFCTVFPNRILGVSQPEEGARSAGIRAVRLEVQEEEGSSGSAAAPILATHNAPLGELPGRVTAWCWDAQGEALVVGTGDGLMALHQCSRADATKKSVAPGGRVVEALAWHPLGAVVLAALEGGVVAMLDAALQPLLVMADLPGCSISGATPSYEVDIAGVLARGGASAVHRRGVAPLLDWARPVTELTADGHRSPLYELVGLAIPCSGPQGFAVGVAQVAVGGVSGGRLRVQELTAQHLSDGEPLRALNLVELAVDRQAQYHGMQLLLDHMLRGGFGGADTSAIMGLIDETLSTLWPQTASFTAAQQAQLQQVVRRYTAKLLDMGWGEVAFKGMAASAAQPGSRPDGPGIPKT